MNWIKACINNKLIIYVCAILVCVIGIFSITIMKIAPFPSIQLNGISITLNYPGANAQTVEQQVTSRVVTGLQSVNNIKNIIANSQDGSVEIDLTLNTNSTEDLLQTEMQIMQAISSSNLPSVVNQPKVEVNKGVSGLMTMALTSDTTPIFKLKSFAKSALIPSLGSLPGVIVSTDDFDPVLKVLLNPESIAQYNLNPIDVAQDLNETYKSSPLGKLNINNQSYALNMPGDLNTLTEFGDLLVGYQHASNNKDINSGQLFGSPIYLKDIADIRFYSRNVQPDNIFKVDGKPAVMINLQTTSIANPFSVSERTSQYLSQFKNDLPRDIKILKIFDMSTLMKASIFEVIVTIIISSILVLLIAFIFLGKFRTTIIPIITIPVCLLGSITFVYLLGFTINILTLLALVIAVGLVVDDAVVVVENITRYLEQGMKKYDAVVKGSSDIALTIIGITLTLVFVYLPIAFSSSEVAALFKPFALTLASAIFISGIVALTLTPVMAVTFLSDAPLHNYQMKFDKVLKHIIGKYHDFLEVVIRFKLIALFIIVILILVGSYFAFHLPKKVFPDDPDRMINIHMVGSYQDTIDSLEQKLRVFSKFYNNKMVLDNMMNINKNSSSGQLNAALTLILKPEYIKASYAFADKINQLIQNKSLTNTYVDVENVSNWGDDFDLSFYVYGGSSVTAINQVAEKITNSMKSSGNFSFILNQINQPQKQLIFDFNKQRAASLGVFRKTITQLLSTYYGGYTLDNYFNIQGLSVPVIVQVDDQDLTNPDSLQKLLVQSPITEKYYPIEDFVSLKIEAKPSVVTTFNGQPAVAINANLQSDYSMGDAIKYVGQLMQEHYPLLQYEYTGNAETYLNSNNETLLIAILGILSIYFLLTILFRNLIDPFIIMLTVPFSIVGGALSLYLIHSSINLYSALGLITLVGLITKHGILIVQFANSELKKGRSVTEAILIATSLRFRPIIMTTLVMTFGALPLIFSSNIFYMARQNLGVTIMGGLIVGTLFSLFVVPLVYVLVKKAEGEE